MTTTRTKPLHGKVLLHGTLACRSGLRIGGSDGELAIGGLDATVIRDPLTRQPYIPGSSLKGKLRSLLERFSDKEFNHNGGTTNNPIWRHECADPACPVCRLFGASSPSRERGDNLPARVLVSDCFLTEESEKELAGIEGGMPYTEWKTENGLDRITCAANPRQIERVPAGAVFAFSLIYSVDDLAAVNEDLCHLLTLLRLLEDDALGGGGSRGNGRVSVTLTAAEVRTRDFYLGTEPAKVLPLAAGGSLAGGENARTLPEEAARHLTAAGAARTAGAAKATEAAQ